MRQDKAFRRYFIAFIMVFVLVFLIAQTVVADGPGGPLTIYGEVYKSNGKFPGEDNERAYAAVIIEHNGAKKTFEDPDGIELVNGTYWYAVTIPEGAWKKGDRFWIWIDGSDWGDENYTCRGHDETDVNSWNIEASGGSLELHVNTGDSNFKPILSIIFAIILAIVGIMVGLLRPLKMPYSGRPTQPADLVEGMVIVGEAQIPEPLPAEGETPAPTPSAEETRTCDTCGGDLEFIKEYDAWYCNNCKKYPDEDEAPPPPDDEAPPPEDEASEGDKEEAKEEAKEGEGDEPPPPPEGGE
jgi:hypothetical protein